MQQMKWYRQEPPMKTAKPKEYGRAEPPMRRTEQEEPLPTLARDALGVRAGQAETPIMPTRVKPRLVEDVVRARVTPPEPAQPDELEVLDWVAQQAEQSLAPHPHLLQDEQEVAERPAIKPRLFSGTRNINRRPSRPFVQAADQGSAADNAGRQTEVAPKGRSRVAFPTGLLRRSEKRGGPPRDPAPSRLRYRLHRLWLTPLFRALLRTGLPAFLVVFSLGMYLANDDRRAAIVDQAEAVVRSVQERPEFMVQLMSIEGASPELGTAIRTAMPVRFPVTSFDLDLDEMRQTVTSLDAVASAELRIKPGGILEVRVTERRASVLWRGPDGLMMLDNTGHPVAPLGSRLERFDLPVIAGDGADRAVVEALQLIDAAEPVAARLRGLVRMGERRWDVVLDNGQRILLPEEGAVEALERVMALAIAEDMLSRDVSVVDMRFTARPTLRLAPRNVEEFRQQEETTQTGATSG